MGNLPWNFSVLPPRGSTQSGRGVGYKEGKSDTPAPWVRTLSLDVNFGDMSPGHKKMRAKVGTLGF